MPNYQQGKIYKIEPICEHEEGDIYIGSTILDFLSKRMIKHRSEYKNNRKNNISSFHLFDKYGVENCKIFLIENYPCNSRDELNTKEGGYTKNMKCVNKRIAGRTSKEYRIDNKEKLCAKTKIYAENNKDKIKNYRHEHYEKNITNYKEHSKEYYEKNKEYLKQKSREYKQEQYKNNKDVINEKAKVKITCECGCLIRKGDISKHIKTQNI